MSRGYFGIGVYEPKFAENVGTLLRSAHAFGADFTFVIGGSRKMYQQPSNTTRSERHIPHFEWATIADYRESGPRGCPLVAVEIAAGAQRLTAFNHPERAAYLLGSEHVGIPETVLATCEYVVEVPGPRFCLNVAVAGSIVIYDRFVRSEVPG